MNTQLINSLIVLASLSTMMGVLVHDTRIDKATAAALDPSSYHIAAHEVVAKSDLHTHVERGSVSQTLHSLKLSLRQQPRSNEDKKYLLQKRVVKGNYPFDNYNLHI